MEEEQKFLARITQLITTSLNGDWIIDQERLDGGYPGVFINGPDDRSLHFTVSWRNTERLEISGSFPYGLSQHLPYDREKTEITVTTSKTPEQIARDITKRLMPPYEKVLTQAKEMKAKADAYQAEKMKALEAVKEAMGVKASIREDEVYSYEPSCRARYYSDGNVKFEITLPVDKVVEILKQINKRQAF